MDQRPAPSRRPHPLAVTALAVGVLLLAGALLLNPVYLVPGLVLVAGGSYALVDRRRRRA